MNFLAPLFLAGAAGIALPVLFHLVRRTTRQKVLFSSLMFLKPMPPRLTRRNRVEHWLLLLLRCAVLMLLALGFARPFLRESAGSIPVGSQARKVLVLLDRSASMRRVGMWAAAQAKATALVDASTAADQLAIYTFGGGLDPVLTFEQWSGLPLGERKAVARQRVAALAPGYGATELDNALIRAADVLGETDPNAAGVARQLVAVTDLAEGVQTARLQGHEWPARLEVVIEQIAPTIAGNAGLSWLPPRGDETAPGGVPGGVRFRVYNASDSRKDQFQIGWALAGATGFDGAPVNLYVPAGQSRTAVLPPLPRGQITGEALLLGDDEPFDNRVSVAPPSPTTQTVLYVGADKGESQGDPLFFLRRGFPETPRQTVRTIRHDPAAPLAESELRNASMLVATGNLSPAIADALRARVETGCVLLYSLTEAASAAPFLARLLKVDRVDLAEGKPNGYGILGTIDFSHPVFLPFADPKYSDFTKIHFWKYRRMDTNGIPAARAVARFDNGDPALVEVPVGKGAIFILTSGWQPADSQLAVSSKFVPFLFALLEYGSGSAAAPGSFQPGDGVVLSSELARAGAAVSVNRPGIFQDSLAAGSTVYTNTATPGLYVMTSGAVSQRFAVNLAPSESHTAPMRPAQLENLGVPMRKSAEVQARQAAQLARLKDTELESRQKLWRWAILGTLCLLLAETVLSGWIARHRMEPAEVQAS